MQTVLPCGHSKCISRIVAEYEEVPLGFILSVIIVEIVQVL
jgi:hypothetical protein